MKSGGFLIPANSKKSMMIFGLFTVGDLIVLGIGIAVTLILLLTLPITQLAVAMIAIAPALLAGFLVFPIPNYHNTYRFIISAYRFYTIRQKFVWKGWCFIDEESKK